MRTHKLLATLAALALAAPGLALAEPPDTVWVENTHVQPAGTTELGFFYELQVGHPAAFQEGFHYLDLRAAAGIARGMGLELTPTLRFAQRGEDASHIDAMGVAMRMLLRGTADDPRLVLYGNYNSQIQRGHEQRFTQGAVVRWQRGLGAFMGDLSLRETFMGDAGTRVELRVGGAATVAVSCADWLRFGLEAFYLMPVVGDRVSDPLFSTITSNGNLYFGPTGRLDIDRMWIAVGGVTGYFSEAGSVLLMRAEMGLRF